MINFNGAGIRKCLPFSVSHPDFGKKLIVSGNIAKLKVLFEFVSHLLVFSVIRTPGNLQKRIIVHNEKVIYINFF